MILHNYGIHDADGTNVVEHQAHPCIPGEGRQTDYRWIVPTLITWAPTGDTVVCEDARGAQGGTGVGCTANPWGVYDTTEVEFMR